MKATIVQSLENVTLLGAGEVNHADLNEALSLAPRLVAADGGADAALAAGIVPDAVIGDFDSISEAAKAAIAPERLHRIAEQDSTDFDKCLAAISAPLVLGLGFLGARLDHQMAALSGVVRQPDVRCVLIGARDVAFLCPPRLVLALPVGARVSLFPMAPVRGESRGLTWPIKGLEFAPDGRIGTSNAACASKVVLEMDAAKMVVIVPRAHLRAVIAALAG